MYLRKNSFFRTVTFRTAFLYFCLFFLILTIVFAFIYLLLNTYILNSIDKESNTLITRFTDAYSGTLFRKSVQLDRDSLRKIPPRLLKTARQTVPNALVLKCEPIQGDQQLLYEFEAITDDTQYGILLDNDGRLLGLEKEPVIKGKIALEREFSDWEKVLGGSNYFFCLLRDDNSVIISSNSPGFPVSRRELQQILAADKPLEHLSYRTIIYSSSSHFLRVASHRLDDGHRIVVVYYMGRERKLLFDYLKTMSITVVVMLLATALAAYWVAFRAMKGVIRVATIADQVTQANIDCTIPVMNEGQEVTALVNSLNRMLKRISLLIQELATVTNSLAHDLKTPITAIRGRLESQLIHGNNVPPDVAEKVIDDCDMVIEVLNTTLETAELNAGIAELSQEQVNVSDVLSSAHELFEPVAEGKDLEFVLDLPGDPLYILCNKQKLQRVIANLIDNALKYTNAGKVELQGRRIGSSVNVTVKDTGCGIAEDEIDRVYEKFYRCDSSRTLPGYGLGLSYVKAVADLCNWKLSISSKPSHGTIVEVSFPAL